VERGRLQLSGGIQPAVVDKPFKISVWNVTVGRKLPACPMVIPSGPSSYDVAYPPPGWQSCGTTGVTFNVGSVNPGQFGIVAANAGVDSYWMSDAIPVQPDRRLGWRAYTNCSAYTSGGAKARVYWYTSAGAYLQYTDCLGRSGIGSSTDWGEVIAPKGAHSARMLLLVAAGSTLTVYGNDFALGAHILEAPAHVPLISVEGEVPAPLEVYGNVDPESDAHSVYYGVGRNVGPYVWEAEALTWSGGAASTLATLFPGTGNTGWAVTGVTTQAALIDMAGQVPGTYELLLRVLSSAAATASFTVGVASGSYIKTVTTTSTVPEWISLGQVTLPTKKTVAGASPSGLSD